MTGLSIIICAHTELRQIGAGEDVPLPQIAVVGSLTYTCTHRAHTQGPHTHTHTHIYHTNTYTRARDLHECKHTYTQ